MNVEPQKWYFKPYAFIIAFLCVGPFALPIVWLNPRYSAAKKIIITAITIVVTFYISLVMVKSIQSIYSYYQQMLKLQ